MSVPEMRRLLGLGKTDSYWLVHQGFFETILVNGRMRVVISSFEQWYSMQTKHRKVTGEEPGTKLHEESYSITEISGMLGICTAHVLTVVRHENLPMFKVHSQYQVLKKEFDEWYDSQNHYVKKQEKDAILGKRYIATPEMARRLGVDRNTVYTILRSRAAPKAIRVGDKWYIEIDSFTRWLADQSKYHCAPLLQKPRNPAFYTVEEVCRYYGLNQKDLYRKLISGEIPAIQARRRWRIKRKEFDEILTKGSGK